jgi:hypothetical protein
LTDNQPDNVFYSGGRGIGKTAFLREQIHHLETIKTTTERGKKAFVFHHDRAFLPVNMEELDNNENIVSLKSILKFSLVSFENELTATLCREVQKEMLLEGCTDVLYVNKDIIVPAIKEYIERHRGELEEKF